MQDTNRVDSGDNSGTNDDARIEFELIPSAARERRDAAELAGASREIGFHEGGAA